MSTLSEEDIYFGIVETLEYVSNVAYSDNLLSLMQLKYTCEEYGKEGVYSMEQAIVERLVEVD